MAHIEQSGTAGNLRGLHPVTSLVASIIAAVLLSVLTLGVFYELQDYGPESAIRKFNQAILANDTDALKSIITPDSDPRANAVLIDRFASRQSEGGRLRLDSMTRQANSVTATVSFVFSNGAAYSDWIVAEKDNRVWKVNPTASLLAESRAIGMPLPQRRQPAIP